MEKVEYVKMNPSGNMTILVLNKFPKKRYSEISKKLMSPTSVQGEQVGFLEKPFLSKSDARLCMMGGEFCSNALASLSAYLAYEENLHTNENTFKYIVEISGTKNPLECIVKIDKGVFYTNIPMPLPIEISHKEYIYDKEKVVFTLIEYEDIYHGILKTDHINEFTKKMAQFILHNYIKNDYSTKGITIFSGKKNNISSLIYVKNTNTEVWENNCGIATASIGICEALRKQKNLDIVFNPSTELEIGVSVSFVAGKIDSVKMKKKILIASKGTAYI